MNKILNATNSLCTGANDMCNTFKNSCWSEFSQKLSSCFYVYFEVKATEVFAWNSNVVFYIQTESYPS